MASEHTPSPHYDALEQPQKESKNPKKKKKVASLPEMLNEENSPLEAGKK